VTSRAAEVDPVADRASAERPTLVAPERRGTVGQRVRVAILALLSWLVSALPEGLVLRAADAAGELWYRTTPERAARARRQLGRVVAWMAEREIGPPRARAAAGDPRALERLVRHAYRHAARYYVEVMRTPRLTPRYLRERVLIETPDVVDAAFATEGPVIFVAMHFGAIELPGLYLAHRSGRPATAPMETVDDPELQRWFVRTRGRVGLRIVGLREARRELQAALRRGEIAGLVADRDITGGGLEVPLFGHPAPLPVGPALLAIESGAPAYVAAVRRAGLGRYRAKVVRIAVPGGGSRRERLTATVDAFARAFEQAIADAPEQWWAVFHPIWPDLAEAPEETA
jgi:phosphatidylinositol dimannoside acyltransferase